MLALLQEVGGSNHLAPKKQCRFTIGLSLTCFYKPGEIAEEMSESENAARVLQCLLYQVRDKLVISLTGDQLFRRLPNS
jgi:hypothetical protein